MSVTHPRALLHHLRGLAAPAVLAGATVKGALAACGRSPGAVVSARAAALAAEGLRGLGSARPKIAAGLLVAGMLALGSATVALTAPPPPAEPAPGPPRQRADKGPLPPEVKKTAIRGLAEGADGRPVAGAPGLWDHSSSSSGPAPGASGTPPPKSFHQAPA